MNKDTSGYAADIKKLHSQLDTLSEQLLKTKLLLIDAEYTIKKAAISGKMMAQALDDINNTNTNPIITTIISDVIASHKEHELL